MANFICAFYHFLSEKKKKKKEKSCLLPPLLVRATFSQLSTVTNKQSKTEEQKLEN